MSGGLLTILVAGIVLFVIGVVVRWLDREPGDGRFARSVGNIALTLGLLSAIASLVPLFFDDADPPGSSGTTAKSPSDRSSQESDSSHAADRATGGGSTTSPRETPDPAPEPTTPTPQGGPGSYAEEHAGVPLAIRPAGESCASAYTAVDFDGDPYAGSTPITLRVLDEDELSSPQLEAIDMRYSGCAGHAVFEVTQGALVGLLRKEETATAERCAQAASGASISGYLDIGDEREATDLGFEVGASLCAVTPTGRVARAKITRIIRPDYDLPAVEFELTTWVRSS